MNYKFKIDNLTSDEKLIFYLIGSPIEKFNLALKNLIISNETDWNKIIKFCSEHGLSSILYKYLKNNNITNLLSEDRLEKLKTYYYYTLKNNVIKQEILNTIQKEFSESKIEILPLKGLYLITYHYVDVAIRPMSDIDILIEEKNINVAKSIFIKLGYSLIPARTSIEEIYNLQYNLQFSKKDSLIELHRNVTPIYSKYRLNIADFWNRKTNSNLSVEAHIIHFCIHFNYNINNRLVRMGWLYDIVSFININDKNIDWKYISEFCIKNNLSKAIFPILYFLQNYYDLVINIDFKINNLDNYYETFRNNITYLIKGDNSKIKIEKNLNYTLKLKLITKWIDKISFLFQLIFPQKSYMIHKYRKLNGVSYIKELSSVISKI